MGLNLGVVEMERADGADGADGVDVECPPGHSREIQK